MRIRIGPSTCRSAQVVDVGVVESDIDVDVDRVHARSRPYCDVRQRSAVETGTLVGDLADPPV